MTEVEREQKMEQCRRVFEAKTGLAGTPVKGGRAVACESTRDLRDATDEELRAELERRTL